MKKHIGKILTIALPIIAVLILLYPTLRAYQLEEKKSEAIRLAKMQKTPADSLARIDAFNNEYGKDLENAKGQAIKLGLDLRGGMYVTLEVDIVKLIEESAVPETVDDLFKEVISATGAEAKDNDKSVIEIFKDKFNKIARPKGKTLFSYFDVGDFKEASEEKIITKLNENAKNAVDQALEVIKQRVDKYHISEPTIQKQGTRRIQLELPGVQNEVEMHQLLQTTARLEFKLLRNNEDLCRLFYKIDQTIKSLKERGELKDTTKKDSLAKESSTATDVAKADTAKSDTAKQAKGKDTSNPYAGLSKDEQRKKYSEDHPFSSLLYTTYFNPEDEHRAPRDVDFSTDNFQKGEYNFLIESKLLNQFNEILSRREIRALIPVDLEILRDAKPEARYQKRDPNVKLYYIYGVKKEPELTGDIVTEARADFDPQTNQPMVTMRMSADGAERWAHITGANIKKRIAIVLDGQIYSAPTVQNKITGGNSQITGSSTAEEANLLAIVLKAGALKAPVQIIEERVVGSSLGNDSIESGLKASLLAVLLVVLFMAIYYSTAGLVADFCVMVNVSIIIAAMAVFHGTLTLPGIAGVILTIGMAVDANVLIYERIREELHLGRSFRSAIDEGYSKALNAVIDTHITTFITGLILYYFGTGTIQSFAMTLMIGVLSTLFTTILVSKAIILLMMEKGKGSIHLGQPKTINS